MKINKIILILFFPIMAQLTFSCCCCNDEGVVPELSSFVTDVDVYNLDNSAQEVVINNSDSARITKTAYGIRVLPTSFLYAENKCNAPQFNFISSAYACSCGEDFLPLYNSQPVRNFKVTTLNNFDSSKIAGADITEYFRTFNDVTNEFLTIDTDSFSINIGEGSDLLLLTPPQNEGTYQFEISFDVNDTISVRDSSKRVFLF